MYERVQADMCGATVHRLLGVEAAARATNVASMDTVRAIATEHIALCA